MFNLISGKLSRILDGLEYYANCPQRSLTKGQFLILGVLHQMHIHVLVYYFNYFMTQPSGWVFLIYTLQVYFVRIPLHFVHFFLGHYTKRKIIRFWECIPLLKGVGFMLIIIRILIMIFNQYYISKLIYTCILFGRHAIGLSNDGWKSCDYEGATNLCLPIFQNLTTNSKNETKYEISIFHFIRLFSNTHEIKTTFFSKPNITLLLINLSLWIAFFIPLFMGIVRFMTHFMILLIAALIPIFIAYVYIISKSSLGHFESERYWSTFEVSRGTKIENKVLFWALSTISITDSLDLPNSVWLGTMMPPSLKIDLSVISIYQIGVFGLFGFVWLAKFSLDLFMDRHKHVCKNCYITTSAYDILTINMEALTQTYQPYLCITVFLIARTLYSTLNNVFAGLVIYDSIIDAMPLLKHNKFLTCIAFCSINCLISILFFTSLNQFIIITWNHVRLILELLAFFIIVISLNYIYSLDMLMTDYIFTYVEEPSKLIKWAWRAAPALAMILFCIVFYNIMERFELESNLLYSCISMVLIMLLPVFLYFCIEAAKGVNKYEYDPDSPAHGWGPEDHAVRYKRNKFVPYRNLNYRHNCVTCKHVCLVKVKEYAEEGFEQARKIKEAQLFLDATDKISKTKKLT